MNDSSLHESVVMKKNLLMLQVSVHMGMYGFHTLPLSLFLLLPQSGSV